MQRDATVTSFAWTSIGTIQGHRVELINRANLTRTSVSIYMPDSYLFIIEATTPEWASEPSIFMQSLWLFHDGAWIRQ